MHLRFMSAMILLTVSSHAADLKYIQNVFQTVLASDDDSQLPRPEVIASQEMEDSIRAISPDEIKTLLPLARLCWQSPRPRVRAAGLDLVMFLTFRPDGQTVIDPVLDEVARMLHDADTRLHKQALFILGQARPRPGSRVWNTINAYLDDKDASEDEIGMIAGTLLWSSPPDAVGIQHVLKVTSLRDSRGLTGNILNQLGQGRITDADALDFVSATLHHQDAAIREAALNTVSRLPSEARGRFRPELRRIEADLTESEKMRSLARSLLRQ